jgi:hypothetical protein
MDIKYLLVPLLMVITVGSCNKMDYKTTMENDKIRVECTLQRLKVCRVSEEDKNTFSIASDTLSTVYGDIDITNLTRGEVTYNLKNYRLVLSDNISSDLCIDSFVDFLLVDKVLRAGEHLRESVYWVFKGKLDTADIGELKLIEVSTP